MTDTVTFRDRDEAVENGLVAIRDEFAVPVGFPDDVIAAAEEAALRTPGPQHADRTGIEFVTLDPATSTDLDQAFAIDADGDDLILRYAIADVGFFVDPDGPIDQEAWRRGTTIYLPGHRAPLYPSVLSEAAASLLADGPRPAVVFAVRIASDGQVGLDGVERAVIRSRAKLAYDTVQPDQLPERFAALSQRIAAAEAARGAPRADFPEQEFVQRDGAWELDLRPRLESENRNAAMSLACNMAVADALLTAHTGLFRVMDEPDPSADGALRNAARALGLEWPDGTSLAEFQRSLPHDSYQSSAFLIAVRRASGKARYEPYHDGTTPWHSAMAATYCHATAPLRRLADRYVVEGALAVGAGEAVPDRIATAFGTLGTVMDEADTRAARVERAAIDLGEALFLEGREGEMFDAVVLDEDDRGVTVQITDPPVIARCRARGVDPGDSVRVRLAAADPAAREVEFERVG